MSATTREHPDAGTSSGDARDEFERDEDRLLYASALRRLSGVTQVTSPNGDVIHHDRLTHSLKVSQVARRMAKTLGPPVEPVVVATAALAHDLGHPPFGHAAEQELQQILAGRILRDGSRVPAKDAKLLLEDSFEGNAQTFRIIARLAARKSTDWGYGLNLTHRTLAAVQKYPWLRSEGKKPYESLSQKKWAAYDPEEQVLQRVLDSCTAAGLMGSRRPLEAQVMDWADDVSYAVHDNEDYFRAGQIPLQELAFNEGLWQEVLAYARAQITPKLPTLDEGKEVSVRDFRDTFDQQARRLGPLFPERRYEGGRESREELHLFGSSSIETLLQDLSIDADHDLSVPLSSRVYVEILKAITKYFVIERAELQLSQTGQRKVIRELFFGLRDRAIDALVHQRAGVAVPALLEDYCELALSDSYLEATVKSEDRVARGVVDYICSLTDRQAVSLADQLQGRAPLRSVLYAV